MKTNTHLQKAKYRKDDEFYTRFEDIEKELDSYNWSNKIVGCPADSEEDAKDCIKYMDIVIENEKD